MPEDEPSEKVALRFKQFEVPFDEMGKPRELGGGGMGLTYRAWDTNLRREVALKVIRPELLGDEKTRKMFLREARANAGLSHRNVAAIYDMDTDGDDYFYAMEYIPGQTVEELARRFPEERIPAAITIQIILQVARALRAAEQQRLIHRDIKPPNIMVMQEEEEEDLVAKLIDFGLARPHKAQESNWTMTGSLTQGWFLGTPGYASPEQISQKEVDVRSDLYSLGMTMWTMLLGRHPIDGQGMELLAKQLNEEPDVEQLAPLALPQSVKDVLHSMTRRDPAERPQSAKELIPKLKQCLASVEPGPTILLPMGGGAQGRMGGVTTTWGTVRGIPVWVPFAVGLVLAAIVGGGGYYAWRMLNPPPELGRSGGQLPGGGSSSGVVIPGGEIGGGGEHPAMEDATARERWGEAQTLTGLDAVVAGLALIQEFPREPSAVSAETWLLELLARRELLDDAGLAEAVAPYLEWIEGRAEDRGMVWVRVLARVYTAKNHPEAGAWRLKEANLELEHGEWGTGVDGLISLVETGDAAVSEEALAALSSTLEGVRLGEADLALHTSRLERAARLPLIQAQLTLARSPSQEPATAAYWYDQAALLAEKNGDWQGVAEWSLHALTSDKGAKAGQESEQRLHRFVAELVTGEARKGLTFASVQVGVQGLAERGDLPATLLLGDRLAESDRSAAIRWKKRAVAALEIAESWEKVVQVCSEIASLDPAEKSWVEGRFRRVVEVVRDWEVLTFSGIRPAVETMAEFPVTEAMMLLAERDFESDKASAFVWYEKAAEAGDVDAMVKTALMASNGDGTDKDPAVVARWLERASDLGNTEARVAFADALLYGTGGVKEDKPRAVELLERAVSDNNARAMEKLGTCAYKGWGMPQDFKRAHDLYMRSVELGFDGAYSNLGIMYLKGEGTEQDMARAVDLWRTGSERGSTAATVNYGKALFAGLGVAKDETQAKALFARAAAAGDADAIKLCKEHDIAIP